MSIDLGHEGFDFLGNTAVTSKGTSKGKYEGKVNSHAVLYFSDMCSSVTYLFSKYVTFLLKFHSNFVLTSDL